METTPHMEEFGMFRTFSRSWALVQASWNVLRSDKELVVFPIASFIGTIIVSITFFIPLLATGVLQAATENGSRGASTAANMLALIILFLFYFVMYTVIIFSNTALVGAALMRLKGQDPTLSDGLKIAQSRFSKILGYAAISATVGVILQMLSNATRNEKNPVMYIIGRIIIGLLGTAWSVATFLVVPVLVVEDLGPIDAIKRSTALLKKTWGEQIVGDLSMGGVFGLIGLGITLLGILLIFVFASINANFLVILTVIAMVVTYLVLALISSTLGGIYRAALYRYATEGEVVDGFTPELIQGAFKVKN
jgi:hypothetical protein